MADVKVRYIGDKKQKSVKLPVPFVSLSDDRGTVQFVGKGSVQSMPAEDAKNLVEIAPESFELVADKKQEKE